MMNLPNKITVARMLLIPIMIIVPYLGFNNILFGSVTIGSFITLIIFLIASFTDFLDGYLARKNNLVTTFGKFLDPIADKLLVLSALIMLVEQGIIPGWIPIIIAAREFIVSGIRMLAAGDGKVIAASWYGKVKTVSQMIAISLAFLSTNTFMQFTSVEMGTGALILNILMSLAMVVAVLMTILSGVDYFMKSKDIVLRSK